MTKAWSRRAPWPYDARVDVGDGTGWHGLMLVPGQDGLAVATSEQRFGNVVPTTYEYGAAPPDRETTWAFGRLTGGMGEAIQSGATSTRYRYASGVDCSVAGFPRLGPLFTAESFPSLPATTIGVKQFVNATNSLPGPVADTVFALVDNRVYRRTAGAWALSKDFAPTAVYPQQAVVANSTSGTGIGLWVAGGGQLWNFDGATWTQATLPAGVSARFVATVRGQLWIGDGVYVAVCPLTLNPLVAASWGGRIQVGDGFSSISWLVPVDDVMYVLKDDGVYTVNADGSVNELFPEWRQRRAVGMGTNAVAWHDRIHTQVGDALAAVDPAGGYEPVGPDLLVGNTSPIRGVPVAMAAHYDWFLYLAVYDAGTNTSHLLKYGTWVPGTDPGDAGAWTFVRAWHGALATWSGKKVTRLDVIRLDASGTPASQPVLWVGFSDGSAQYAVLPAATPDPVLDASCRFGPSGTVYAPLHDARFGADPKAFHGVTYLGPTLDATRTAQVVYRWTTASGYTGLGSPVTATGTRVEFPDITGGFSRDASAALQIDFGVTLATGAATATPVLEGVALHEAVRPALRLAWSFRVRAGNRVVRRDGVVDSQTPEATRALLKVAAGAAGHTRWQLPEETVAGAAVVELGDAIDPDRGRDGPEATMPVRVIQFR